MKFIFLFFLSLSVNAENITKQKVAQEQERRERNIDQAALEAQKKGIQKLKKLTDKYRGTAKESQLLFRLSEMYQESATILFRIAHGQSQTAIKRKYISLYHNELNRSVLTLNRLIKKFPRFRSLSRAYFIRAHAYKENRKISLAKRDYRIITQNFPQSYESLPSYMELANFEIEGNRHAKALQYLRPILKSPDNRFYPLALYKTAWAQYNLRFTDSAIRSLQTHIQFYQEISKRNPSDEGILQNSLMDMTLFYLDGFEQQPDRYSISKALSYFESLSKDLYLQKMNLKFARLLRSHRHDQELIQWKNAIVDRYPRQDSSFGVLLTVLEHQWNHRRFDELVKTSVALTPLYLENRKNLSTFPSYQETQKFLADTTQSLRKMILKNKKATQVNRLSSALADLYHVFISIIPENDPRVMIARYNLAETLFQVKNFPEATQNYRWILAHSEKPRPDIELKAIASQYEFLHAKKIIPKEVAVSHLSKNEGLDTDHMVVTWIKWIDGFKSRFPSQKKEIETFEFESIRTLYALGAIKEALKRLEQFARENPSSQYGIPAAGLALDTYIESEKWNSAYALSEEFRKSTYWQKRKKSKFYQKLFQLSSNSFYKIIENDYSSKRLKAAAEKIDVLLEEFPNNPRQVDALFMRSKIALHEENHQEALIHLNPLIANHSGSNQSKQALLERAMIYEKQFELKKSALDYQSYVLSTKNTKLSRELKKKILRYFWLENANTALKKSIDSKKFCSKEFKTLCDRFLALLSAEGHHSLSARKKFNRALHAPKKNRAIWAIAALQDAKAFSVNDRLLLKRILAGRMKDLDPIESISMLPHARKGIQESFLLNRKAILKFARISGNEKSISHRISVLQSVEKTTERLLKIPYSDIRAQALGHMAQLYLDFSQDLSRVTPPTGLNASAKKAFLATLDEIAQPFFKKGANISQAAFALIQKNSAKASVVQDITRLDRELNPNIWKKRQWNIEFRHPSTVHLGLLEEIYSNLEWDKLDPSQDNKTAPEHHWRKAYQEKNLKKEAYLLGKLEDNDSAFVPALQAALYFQIDEPSLALPILDRKPSPKANRVTLTYRTQSFSVESLSSWEEKSTRDEIENTEQAFAAAYGLFLCGEKLAPEDWIDLLEEAAGSSIQDYQAWAKAQIELTSPKISPVMAKK